MTYFARLEHSDNGYPCDQENIKVLNPNIYYKVENVSIGQSHSSCKLVGITPWFNTVQLGFYDETMKPVDILKTEYNCYEENYKSKEKANVYRT